jgi:hypothetical protein
MNHRIIKIVDVKVIRPHTLWLRFDDGLERTIDFSAVLAGEIYESLLDPECFGRVRLDEEVHTVVWPNGADFDPETLHDWPSVEADWKARAAIWQQERKRTETTDEAVSVAKKARNLERLAGT